MTKNLSGIELNLRTRAWGLYFDERNLYLTAIRNKIGQVQYAGFEVLRDFHEKPDEEVREFIEDFQSKHGLKRGDAYLLAPRSSAVVQMADFPPEAADNLEEVMEYQLENYFPMKLDEWAFFPQIVSKGDMLKVMLVAVKNERLGDIFSYIRRWNLKLAGLSLDTFGLVNGLAKIESNRFAAEKTAILRFFPNGVEMAVVNQGRLAVSHYFEAAEDMPRDQLAAQLEQGFSLARLDPNEIDRYIAAGDDLPELRAYLQDEVGFPFEACADGAGTAIPDAALTGFGGAVTAVHEKPTLGLNMLPDNLRKRHQRLPIMLGTAALIIFAIYFFYTEIRGYSSLSAELARADQQLSEVTESMNLVSSARSEFQTKQAQLQMFERYQASNMLIKVLFSLSQDLPDNTFLTNMTVKSGKNLSIQGESDEPFEIQAILSRMTFLRDVKPVNAITAGRNRDGKKRFNFKATIVLEALK